MEPLISFRDYTFKYRAQKEPTLKSIDLDIYPGEKILIAGQSGSGKSTLVHCLNALIPCSYAGDVSGTLKVDGKDPTAEGVFGMSKSVGTVLQDTDGQFIGLTVAEDIAFALENEAMPLDELKENVAKAAETVEMTEYLDHSPSELSGGQKQRVSLGGVLVDDVKILLFDEPLANLDPATGKNTIALIDEIMQKKDVTVIIIEHRLEDVLYKKVDRVILMDEGEIVEDSAPGQMLCSDILSAHGIREPLYISALKAAGCVISPKDHPEHIDTLDCNPYEEKVRSWFCAVSRPERVRDPEEVLRVEKLGFSYNEEKKILKNVSFTVNKGELVALVGKNGAGKSTLASVICGFYHQDEGMIYLNGQDISGLSVTERGERIGYVMQSPNQMISKPMISDEVALGLVARNVPDDEVKERVNDALKICGLYPYRNWPVSALSFGQKKRVSIASILVMKPEILILDEPTAGQDYSHYTEIMEFIRSLRDEMGLTIIMITHDMHLMLEYTDRAVVLCDGEILADTTPADVLSDEALSEKAYLKKTSLYDLALKCCINEPTEFIDRFISFERTVRSGGTGEVS